MKRALLLTFFFLASWTSSAFSIAITPIITGADMAGMQVTASFSDGSSETLVWGVTGTNGATPFGEGFSGGVNGSNWSLNQQGFSLGNFSGSGDILGLWSLVNTSSFNLTELVIDAFAGGIVFDISDVDISLGEGTPGSHAGRSFLTGGVGVVTASVYDNIFSAPDLYGRLTLSLSGFDQGSTLTFLADTDKIPVPTTILLLSAGLLGLGVSRLSLKQSVVMGELKNGT